MPNYEYQVKDMMGRAASGVLAAADATEASRLLRRDGKTVVSLHAAAEEAPMLGGGRRIGRNDIIYFATQLAVMVDTGVPLPEALDAIADQSDHVGLKQLIGQLSSDVKGGVSFSAALGKHPKAFGPLFVALMRASEASGTMGQMLQRASDYMVEEQDTRRRVKGAMVYPACMLTFCVLVVVALLVFILPRFEKIYTSKGAALPTPTRILMGMSNGLIEYWYLVVGGVVAAVVGGWYFFKRTQSGALLADRIRISLPLLGPMYRKVCIARSLRTMATMVSTGVSMLEGLSITAQAAGNRYYAAIWDDLAAGVKEGANLSDQLMECKLVPRTISQMIAAGEKTGKLSLVMNRVAGFCEEELKVAIKTLTSMIEPLMIIIMGLLVGGIAMALLLPIFSISKVVAH
jgi:type IV pilus assembly protein PilC